MAITYFGSGLKSGSGTLTEAVDGGFVVLSQSTTITAPLTATNVDVVETLPANSQILNIIVEKPVDRVGGTATTLNVSVGNVASGTQYLPAVDMFGVASSQGVPTVANVLARGDIGATTSVYIRVTPNGTSTTAAQIRVTVIYAQKV